MQGVSQATWTKVSSPSILTSLYPTSHGVIEFIDRLPASATTMAEVFRDAGYATLSFSGRQSRGRANRYLSAQSARCSRADRTENSPSDFPIKI